MFLIAVNYLSSLSLLFWLNLGLRHGLNSTFLQLKVSFPQEVWPPIVHPFWLQSMK